MDCNWDQDDFEDKNLSTTVVNIHICAYVNELNAGDGDDIPPTNHWAMFLELPNRCSVRLDMVPGYGSNGLRGMIHISSKTYHITHNAIQTVSFPAAQGITVRTITNTISTNKRQKYTFTEEMEGCRFWIYMVISDLESGGIIDHGSATSAWEAVSHYWRYPEGSELRPVKQGHFRS